MGVRLSTIPTGPDDNSNWNPPRNGSPGVSAPPRDGFPTPVRRLPTRARGRVGTRPEWFRHDTHRAARLHPQTTRPSWPANRASPAGTACGRTNSSTPWPPLHRTNPPQEEARRSPTFAAPVQQAAARNTSGSPEESKYDVGVPTRDLSARGRRDLPAGYGKDRIVCMVRDPYWLHAYWELTRQAIQRAEAALGQDWHAARPILRLLDVTSTRHVRPRRARRPRHRDPRRLQQLVHRREQPAAQLPHRHRLSVAVAAGSTSWPAPTSSRTPRAGVSDVIDENWADLDAQQGRSHLRHVGRLRPGRVEPGAEAAVRGASAPPDGVAGGDQFRLRRPAAGGKGRKFFFQIDAELIVYGATRAERPRDAPGRAGAAAGRRHVHDAFQRCRTAGRSSRRWRRRRTASRSGRSCWRWSATPSNSSR